MCVTIVMLSSHAHSFLGRSALKIKVLHLADIELKEILLFLEEDFDSVEISSTTSIVEGLNTHVGIASIDNFTKKAEVSVEGYYHGSLISAHLSSVVTDIRESEGQSSCRPVQDPSLWERPRVSFFDLGSIVSDIYPTDVDVVGHLAYFSSNSSRASDPDLFIFDIENPSHVVEVSHLNTGPGASALRIAGNHAYVSNTSINAQLQIIDISDRRYPEMTSSFKLLGTYGSSTPLGTALFYKSGKIVLGTSKSDIGELHYIDVMDFHDPIYLDSVELGHGVNDIFAFKDKVYVASAHKDELKVFDVGVSGTLQETNSYNDPGATGNGKRLSLFLDTLYFGKTKTFNHYEFFSFPTSSTSLFPLWKYSMPTSIQGLSVYGNLAFVGLHQLTDSFLVLNVASSSLMRLNDMLVDLPAPLLDFDCDRDMFVVISEGSSVITFITHQ